MKSTVLALAACSLLALPGCDAAGINDNNNNNNNNTGSEFNLSVTERSGSTLTLKWDAMPTAAASLYTVDFFVMSTCEFPPTHNDVQHVTGTTVQLTGLTAAAKYNIHVHDLPNYKSSTNVVLVQTLAAGSPTTSVSSSDYQKC